MARLRRAEELGGRACDARLDPFAGCRRGIERSAGSRDLGLEKERPTIRRLHHAAAGAVPGAMDLPLGLVPRSQSAALRSTEGAVVRRVCTRDREADGAGGTSGEQYS